MTDPLSLAAVSLQFLSKTTEALNVLRERAQRSKDIDIKDQINTLYDNVLGLKEVVSRLLDENKRLRDQIEAQQRPAEKPKIRQVGQTNYYYVGEEGPYCQPCYDGKNKTLVALLPPKRIPLAGCIAIAPFAIALSMNRQTLTPTQLRFARLGDEWKLDSQGCQVHAASRLQSRAALTPRSDAIARGDYHPWPAA